MTSPLKIRQPLDEQCAAVIQIEGQTARALSSEMLITAETDAGTQSLELRVVKVITSLCMPNQRTSAL